MSASLQTLMTAERRPGQADINNDESWPFYSSSVEVGNMCSCDSFMVKGEGATETEEM